MSETVRTISDERRFPFFIVNMDKLNQVFVVFNYSQLLKSYLERTVRPTCYPSGTVKVTLLGKTSHASSARRNSNNQD